MKKSMKRIVSGLATSSMLLTGAAAQAETAEIDVEISVAQAESREYVKTANVEGKFSFDQDMYSPNDELFNIFGTAVTGMCAKPVFALEADEEGDAKYFVNVGGKVKHMRTVDLRDLKDTAKTKMMLCSCGMSMVSAVGQVKGIPLSSIVEIAELEENVNTVTIRGEDGYGMAIPLSYALNKEALIVYEANGKAIPSGTQLWIPDTIAKYFTRKVVDIEFAAEENVPEVEGAQDEYRAKVNIMNYTDATKIKLGEEIHLEGFADDCGSPIAAVEFSMDGGETWTSCKTEGAVNALWVHWEFAFVPQAAGVQKMDVRAVTEDGTVSPLASSVVFTVE